MNLDLELAARKALVDHRMVTPGAVVTKALIEAEWNGLRKLVDEDRYDLFAARATLLTVMGWRRTDIANGLGISRVTLGKWITENSFGSDTYTSIEPATIKEEELRAHMWSSIPNLLSMDQAAKLSNIRFVHDKFVVPPGFVQPLQMLWRIAYRSRGADTTSDVGVAASGNALDVLISLLLRRGVTNLAIAKAAGVTHRAVIDRMNRARARHLVLECGAWDASCEAFIGEDQLKALPPSIHHSYWESPSVLPSDETWLGGTVLSDRVTPVRISSQHPNRFWLSTGAEQLVDPVGVQPVSGMPDSPAFAELKFRMAVAGYPVESHLTNDVYEPETALRIGRLTDKSAAVGMLIAKYRDDEVTWVPTALLYTELNVAAGNGPLDRVTAYKHIPLALRRKYFEPFDLIHSCFTAPDEVGKDYPATTKHGEDAGTRRENKELESV